MCSSCPSRRRGLSILEVLIASVLFVVALIPVTLLFGSARRVSASAERMLKVSNHSQMILEAVSQLEASELPVTLTAGAPVVLLEDVGGGPGLNGTRWDEIRAYFDTHGPFDLPEGSDQNPDSTPFHRRLTAEDLGPGGTLLRLEVSWQRLPGKPETQQSVTLVSLVAPEVW